MDDLTGLANRRGFFALGEHGLLVAARTRSSIALLFIDVDGLKRVNGEGSATWSATNCSRRPRT